MPKTNEVLVEKLDGMRRRFEERFDMIDEQFKKLNGQTEKNTTFRIKQSTQNKLIWGGILLAVPIISLIIKIL